MKNIKLKGLIQKSDGTNKNGPYPREVFDKLINEALANIPNEKKEFYQDGADFYDDSTGKLIASYKEFVKGDYDTQGSQEAEKKFFVDHPEYAPLREESDFAKKYAPNEIKTFMDKSDVNSPYKPQLKLNWGGDGKASSTKWISVDWDTIEELYHLLDEKQ